MPPYRYVPGVNPHPFRHEGGHMYPDGSAPSETSWFPYADWREDSRFLFAVDLFDLAREAHRPGRPCGILPRNALRSAPSSR